MTREGHVRFWERVGVRFPCATRLDTTLRNRASRNAVGPSPTTPIFLTDHFEPVTSGAVSDKTAANRG
jgi:hypothetical protein